MEELSLDDIRAQLDQIDDNIVDLLADRFKLISQVSAYKKAKGMPVYQSGRENEILDRVVGKGEDLGLNPLLLQALFLQIFAVSRRDQDKQV
jgi:chorismate mutase